MRSNILSWLPSWCVSHALIRSARLWRVCALSISCALALSLAACAQFTTAQPGPYYPDLVAPANPTATLAPAAYTVAAWPANSEPRADQANTIYVAFRRAGTPVPGAQVTLYVQSGDSAQSYGQRETSASGYAAFILNGLAERPNQHVSVQITVIYDGQSYSATTDFTPAP